MKEIQQSIEPKTWYFFRFQTLVIDDEKLSAYDKSTYAVLSKYADVKTGKCYPSLNTLAKKAGCSIPRLIKSLNNLIEAGYITKKNRQKKDGGNTSNLYIVKDLSYIKNVLDYYKNDEKKYNILIKRIKKHPLPSYEQIFTLVNEINKGVVNEINNPCKRGLHELELYNYNNNNNKLSTQIITNFKKAFNSLPNKLQIEELQKVNKNLLNFIIKWVGKKGKPQEYLMAVINDILNNEILTIEEFKQHIKQHKTNKGNKTLNKDYTPLKNDLNELYKKGYR